MPKLSYVKFWMRTFQAEKTANETLELLKEEAEIHNLASEPRRIPLVMPSGIWSKDQPQIKNKTKNYRNLNSPRAKMALQPSELVQSPWRVHTVPVRGVGTPPCINPCCQLDCCWTHPGDRFLNMSVRVFQACLTQS